MNLSLYTKNQYLGEVSISPIEINDMSCKMNKKDHPLYILTWPIHLFKSIPRPGPMSIDIPGYELVSISGRSICKNPVVDLQAASGGSMQRCRCDNFVDDLP